MLNFPSLLFRKTNSEDNLIQSQFTKMSLQTKHFHNHNIFVTIIQTLNDVSVYFTILFFLVLKGKKIHDNLFSLLLLLARNLYLVVVSWDINDSIYCFPLKGQKYLIREENILAHFSLIKMILFLRALHQYI